MDRYMFYSVAFWCLVIGVSAYGGGLMAHHNIVLSVIVTWMLPVYFIIMTFQLYMEEFK